MLKKSEVDFLGFKISYNSIKPQIARAQGILCYERPKNKKALQRFLGLVNYDRTFIEKLSLLALPLYGLLGNDKRFEWNDEHEKAFKTIKDKWASKLELVIPDMKGNFTLETDASDKGIGAVLRQDGAPIAYISRTLNKAERNYGITDREILAGLWAMEKLAYYLDGKNFVLITDHKAIEALREKREFGSARVCRWFERLEKFNFSVKYTEGKNMVVPDALSRASQGEQKEESIDTVLQSIQEKILQVHKNMGHRKSIEKDLKTNNINISKKKLRNILKQCPECQRKDTKPYKIKGFVKTSYPGEKVGIDLLEISKKQKVLILIDYFSRYVFAKIINTKHGYKILEFIKSVYYKFKFKSMTCDNGKEFNNNDLIAWAKSENIQVNYSVPYFHESNGRVERVNRTIREAIKKTSGTLKKSLGKIVEAYNNSIHRGIGISPKEALNKDNYEKVREHQKNYAKEFGEFKRKKNHLKEGQKVLLRNELKTTKMDDSFKELGTIVSYEGNGIYKVKTNEGRELTRHDFQLREFYKGDVGDDDVWRRQEEVN